MTLQKELNSMVEIGFFTQAYRPNNLELIDLDFNAPYFTPDSIFIRKGGRSADKSN